MKKFLILLMMTLSACAPVMTATPVIQDEPGSLFNVTPIPLDLSLDSTSEQIQRAMLESATYWSTLQMEGSIVRFLGDGATQEFQEKVWLDPLNNRFRVESTNGNIKLSDGANIYNANLNSGNMESYPYPDSGKVGQYVPALVTGESHPNPIWGQIGTPLAELAFSSDYAQGQGIFSAVGTKSVAGHDALVVEWRFEPNSAPVWKIWLDMKTAVMLKMQSYSKDGSGRLEEERAVTSISYDLAFDSATFALPSDLAQVVASTPINGGQPFAADSNPKNETGEIYFFLQPRGAGGSIQLAKVSALCIFDSAKCPALEKVDVPFPFKFTINALSWSPNGQYAAFSYSDQPNGTPTKLWLFDPKAKTWIPLAQFPFIDPPFWSPDGTWIAFRSQDGLGGEDVYVVRPDGSELKSISADLPAEGRPYIMDGWYTENVIMRSAIPGRAGDIYLVRAANGQARPMFETQLTKAQFVASPDAGFLAYDEYDETTQVHSVKVMEPDGANQVTIAQFTAGSIYPMVWSPDGSLIAFNYYSFNNGEPTAEVYVITRTGKNLSLVYEGMTIGRLIFSPGGRYLLVEETTSITGGHLFVVDLGTLKVKILDAPGLSTDYDWYAPSWRP